MKIEETKSLNMKDVDSCYIGIWESCICVIFDFKDEIKDREFIKDEKGIHVNYKTIGNAMDNIKMMGWDKEVKIYDFR